MNKINEQVNLREKKDGQKLLELYRKQREYTYPTLEGRKVEPNEFARKMFALYEKEIEILSKTIGARAKTRLTNKL